MNMACWRRAGMSGVETGLDLEQCLARMPEDVEAHAVRRLLLAAEAGVAAAIAERRKSLDK
ncbi:hypothetical protein [Parvibaculum sp.]|uniref:hypothetical protein n=1 Tax=Parvibaculum sp. TaxID=2024848 RepID=UPI001D4BF09A|nr:hypothetical protein [Parvibaculum sp.]MBX3488864.1 hypothetical protein [Parvibaculum sp.]